MSKKYKARQQNRHPVRLQEKVNPAYRGIVGYSDLPHPVTMDKNYKAYAKEGYAQNTTLYKCIKYIMQNGAAIEPKLYTDKTCETEIKSHPLLEKLARPNPEQTGVEFREAVLGYYLIAANSYIYVIRDGRNAPPDELWTLEPDKVKVIPSKTRGIVGYEYADFEQPIPPENIGRIKSWNPTNPLYGMSAIEVGAILVDMQTASNKWNLALLQNYGRTPGAWVAPATMDYNSRKQLELQLQGKFGGFNNAGKSPVLDGGLEWKSMSVPPADMDWLKGRQLNAVDIANLLDIPPQLIGDTSSSTYHNMQEAKIASYTEGIFPHLDKFYALLTNWLLPMYSDLKNAYLSYDKESVEVIQDMIQAQKSAQAERATKAYMAGAMTLNQSLEAQGLPDLGPQGDVYRIGSVLVPADKLLDYANQSLAMPAAPPRAEREPLDEPPPKEPNTPPEPQSEDDDDPPDEPDTKSYQPREKKVRPDSPITHLMWEVDGHPCESCMQNEGAIVPCDDQGNALEAYPNGCGSVYDSHPFCMCREIQLSLPKELDTDDIDPHKLGSGDEQHLDQSITISGNGKDRVFDLPLPLGKKPTVILNGKRQSVGEQGATGKDWYWKKGETKLWQDKDGTLITSDDNLDIKFVGIVSWDILMSLFALGIIESRHAQDVAEQQRRKREEGESLQYAKSDRRRRRDEFRAFRQSTLG